MRDEIKYILGALEVRNPSASSYRTRLLEVLHDTQALISFADKLKQETQSTKGFPDDRILFYDFYLTVAWRENNVGLAKDMLSNAVHGFRIRDFALNEALSEWLFSIIHFENKKYDRAQRACETALNILQQLIQRCEEESKYEKAREIKKHFSELRIFQETIKEPSSENQDFSEILSSTPIEEVSVKSKLQYFHAELNKIYDHLREQRLRIPPTLVAAIFYVYKTIAPSHSLYSKVPPPETNREKEFYEELLEKVRFFEVVEQLVALEQEFTPMASREEMLKKINQEWDREINR